MNFQNEKKNNGYNIEEINRYSKKIFITSFIIVIILLLLFNYGTSTFRAGTEGDYRFNVDLITISENNYTVLIPAVIDNNGRTTPELMNNLEIVGSGTYQIIENERGALLQIDGIGNLSIKSKYKFSTLDNDEVRYDFSPGLSTVHEGKEYWPRKDYCWAYLSNNSNVNDINISAKLQVSENGYFWNGIGQGGWNWGTSGSIGVEGNISKNWNEIEYWHEIMHGDAFVGWGFFTPVGFFFIIGFAGLVSSVIVLNYLRKLQKKYPDIKFESVVDYTRLIIIGCYIFVLIELILSFLFSAIYYLGEPSVMNVLQISSSNNIWFILPILVIFGVYLLHLIDLKMTVGICLTCGRPMPFISDYNRYYCYNCKQYE